MHSGTMEERGRRVLIVDDDKRLQDVVREFLENYGFEVSALENGKGLSGALERLAPDIVLLDVMLPGDDGFTLLRALRGHSRIPVIMLTACGDDTDRIIGLEIGADDYLPKPFNPRELLARIKAVLRRVTDAGEGAGTDGTNGEDRMLKAGAYVLDERRQRLTLDEKSLDLSTTEFRILQAFMSRPGEVLSREKVLSLVFGDDHFVCDRNIDVYISRIRALLRKLGDEEQRIRTVWGSGYAWVEGE
jgi:two-component system phosphate regulon response regulator OmpR